MVARPVRNLRISMLGLEGDAARRLRITACWSVRKPAELRFDNAKPVMAWLDAQEVLVSCGLNQCKGWKGSQFFVHPMRRENRDSRLGTGSGTAKKVRSDGEVILSSVLVVTAALRRDQPSGTKIFC